MAAGFDSILFEQADVVGELAQPDYFVDLNLDQVLASMTAGREQYELRSFFYAPLHDVAAVRYRHEALRDLDKPQVRESITTFAEAMTRMREHLGEAQKLHYPLQQQAWFLDAVEIYCDAVKELTGGLAARDVTSRALRGLRDYTRTRRTTAPRSSRRSPSSSRGR
jgi:DNA mismatch repair protein MutS